MYILKFFVECYDSTVLILILFYSDRQFCIEVTTYKKRDNNILVMRNDKVVDIILGNKTSIEAQMTCFDSFNIETDIYELQYGKSIINEEISVKLINRGVVKQLLVGLKTDFEDPICLPGKISTPSITIQNGSLIASECKGLFKLLFQAINQYKISQFLFS